MTVAWRTTVPETAEMGTYRETPEDDADGFKPELGPSKRRARTMIQTSLVSFTTRMTKDEVGQLLEMYEDDLERGTLVVTRTHPRLGTSQAFEFIKPPDVSDRTWEIWNVGMQFRWLP